MNPGLRYLPFLRVGTSSRRRSSLSELGLFFGALMACTGLTAPVRYRSNFLPFCTPCPFFRGLGYVFRGGRVDLPLSLQGVAPVQPHKKRPGLSYKGPPGSQSPVARIRQAQGQGCLHRSRPNLLTSSCSGPLVASSSSPLPERLPRQFDSIQFISGIPTPNYSNWLSLSSILRYGVAIPSASSLVPAIMEWVDGNFTDDITRSGTMFGEF